MEFLCPASPPCETVHHSNCSCVKSFLFYYLFIDPSEHEAQATTPGSERVRRWAVGRRVVFRVRLALYFSVCFTLLFAYMSYMEIVCTHRFSEIISIWTHLYSGSKSAASYLLTTWTDRWLHTGTARLWSLIRKVCQYVPIFVHKHAVSTLWLLVCLAQCSVIGTAFCHSRHCATKCTRQAHMRTRADKPKTAPNIFSAQTKPAFGKSISLFLSPGFTIGQVFDTSWSFL